MRAVPWAVAVSVCSAAASTLSAQQTLDANDRQFINAAVLVLGHDILVTRCAADARMPDDGAARISAWAQANEVELVRGRSRELEQDPDTRKQFDFVRRMFTSRFAAKGQAACKSAVDATQRRDAQFATSAPAMIAALRARSGPTSVASATPTAPAPTTAPSSPPPNRTAATPVAPPAPVAPVGASSELVARIQSFAFDTRPTMGVGGFIGLEVYPVVLFRDGMALTDIEGLGMPGGIDAHKRAHPDDWKRWRKVGNEIQMLEKGKWDKLAFTSTFSTLPRGFKLNGRFRRTGGVGNIAIGGSQSVTVVSQYLFSPDGLVVRDGAAGSTAATGNTSVVTSSVAPNLRGHYTVDGITLVIRYDSGAEERRILVTDPNDPKSPIWLDGASYVRR